MDIQGFTDSVSMANTTYQLMNFNSTEVEHEDMRKSRSIARISRALDNLEAKRVAEKENV